MFFLGSWPGDLLKTTSGMGGEGLRAGGWHRAAPQACVLAITNPTTFSEG